VRFLLDSDVMAGALKGRLPIVLKLSQLKPSEVAVSVVSRMEAETAMRLQPRAQARYGKLLKEFLATVTVIDFGATEAQQAVVLSAYLQPAGEQLAALDLMLAATAVAHQLTLVTDRSAVFASVPNLDLERWV